MKKETEKKTSFESQMKRLEEIVRVLDDGSASLEDAMKLYEEGIILSGNVFRTLNEAEAKMVTLQKKLNTEIKNENGEEHA